MKVKLKLHHICSQYAERIKDEVNYFVEHSEHYVQSIDTNFDGTMFNAYIKIEVPENEKTTPPPVNESLDEKFRALCDEYGCRGRAVEIAKELLSTARQEEWARLKSIFDNALKSANDGSDVVDAMSEEFDSLTSKGGTNE